MAKCPFRQAKKECAQYDCQIRINGECALVVIANALTKKGGKKN
jgi:hypothetical protein